MKKKPRGILASLLRQEGRAIETFHKPSRSFKKKLLTSSGRESSDIIHTALSHLTMKMLIRLEGETRTCDDPV